MKGIVFTEFADLVASAFGMDVLDDIIEAAELPGDGAYTSTGTYDHQELVRLVTELSKAVGTPVNELIHTFGVHLAKRFAELYPVFFEQAANLFEFLESVDSTVHVEVEKLYPDAELPRFATRWAKDGAFEMVYQSDRMFADLAHGLIEGSAIQFGTNVTIERSVDDNGAVTFRIRESMKLAS